MPQAGPCLSQMPDRQASDVTVSATPFVAIVSRGANIDPALSASSASSAVIGCPQAVSTAERAELWEKDTEPMRAQGHCSVAPCVRRSRIWNEHVVGDKLRRYTRLWLTILARRRDNPPIFERPESSGVVPGFIMRPGGVFSDPALSASSAISAVIGCPHDGEAAQPGTFVFVAGGGLDWLKNGILTGL